MEDDSKFLSCCCILPGHLWDISNSIEPLGILHRIHPIYRIHRDWLIIIPPSVEITALAKDSTTNWHKITSSVRVVLKSFQLDLFHCCLIGIPRLSQSFFATEVDKVHRVEVGTLRRAVDFMDLRGVLPFHKISDTLVQVVVRCYWIRNSLVQCSVDIHQALTTRSKRSWEYEKHQDWLGSVSLASKMDKLMTVSLKSHSRRDVCWKKHFSRIMYYMIV